MESRLQSPFCRPQSSHVFYISQPDLHVRELYYINGRWWGNDLTADTNGPSPGSSLSPSLLTSFFDGSIAHVFCTSYPDNRMRELYYTNGQWWGNDLTADTKGAPGFGLTGFFGGSIAHVF